MRCIRRTYVSLIEAFDGVRENPSASMDIISDLMADGHRLRWIRDEYVVAQSLGREENLFRTGWLAAHVGVSRAQKSAVQTDLDWDVAPNPVGKKGPASRIRRLGGFRSRLPTLIGMSRLRTPGRQPVAVATGFTGTLPVERLREVPC